MDFEIHYTEEQELFRREVILWLEANLPADGQISGGGPGLDPAVWNQWLAFRRRLGEKGWLALGSPAEWSGRGLTRDQAVVLREELGRRGLDWLRKGASSLGPVLQQWGTEEQKRRYLPGVFGGLITLWHLVLEPDAPLDTDSLGIAAVRDGDDYVLNGTGLFGGFGPRPDYLWTLARLPSAAAASSPQSTAAFLIPSGLAGIRIHSQRLLVPEEARRLTFDNVYVPSTCLLGGEGTGWSVMQASLRTEPLAECAPAPDQEVTDLIGYAQETTVEGIPLSQEPFLQQLLVEAYLDSFVASLFRTRNAWMAAAGRELTYHTAQAALLEKQAALRRAAIARDVMGMYVLLDHQDPAAPFRGRAERQQRQAVAKQNSGGGPNAQMVEIARHLGLGQRTDERVTPPGPSHRRTEAHDPIEGIPA